MILNPKYFELPQKATYKLDKIRKAVEDLGHPELGRKTILVAGTNGKGSVCQYLTNLFIKTGLKVGTYTSPHIVDRTERIRIQGKTISELLLKRYEKRYQEVLEPLTYFERFTVLAFLIFRDLKIDLQVLEVGMGGRLDATNLSDPDFSVITAIHYDHQEILGKSLSAIAREKAGIMRGGRLTFSSSQVPEVRRRLRKEAAALDVLLRWPSQNPKSRLLEKVFKEINWTRGKHQEQNARLAYDVYQEASKKWGLSSSVKNSIKALQEPLGLARLQIFRKDPPFIIDGAHNLQALTIFCDYVKRLYPDKVWTCIFGIMEDKPAQEALHRLKPFIQKLYLPVFYPERQMSPEKLRGIWNSLGKDSSQIEKETIVSKILSKEKRVENPLMVVGSFYLAGEVLKHMKEPRVL